MTRKLFEIQGDIQGLIDIMEAGDLEAAAMFEKELKVEAEEKLVNYFRVIKQKEADIIQAKEAEQLAADFRKKAGKEIEWLESRIKETLVMMGKKKIDRPDCKITMQEGRMSLQRCKVEELPVEFVTPVESLEADWKKIEATIKEIAEKINTEGPAMFVDLHGKDLDKAIAKEIETRSIEATGCKMKQGEAFLKYPKIKTITGEE